MRSLGVFLLMLSIATLEASSLTLTIAPYQTSKAKLMILSVSPTQELIHLSKLLCHNLSCENQKLNGFNVKQHVLGKFPTQRFMRGLYAQGFSLVLLLSQNENNVEWRLYDPDTITLYEGRKVSLIANLEMVGNSISDRVWRLLTGQEGFFSSKIAYCKEHIDRKKGYKSLCISAPQDSSPTILISHAKVLAPRWHSDPDQPIIFYSAITPSNVRLMAVSLQGDRYKVSNFDGITMLPSLTHNGAKMAYCLTHKGKTDIYCVIKEGNESTIKKFPLLSGNNFSPILFESGDLIFCSDTSGTPKIYRYRAETEEIALLTPDGYCSSPSWCKKTNSLAYCKLSKGTMQIFAYDFATNKHSQLTFSPGNKDECCWSPCGNYLAFSKNNRIALFNLLTKEEFFLTKEDERCTYPTWSPSFANHSLT